MTDDRSTIRALHRAPEPEVLEPLLAAATLPPPVAARVAARARALVRATRAAHTPGSDITDFLTVYGLGTREGVALLCLAEALLRIPDTATADALIDDRIAGADWQAHLGQADSLTVNASSWAFMLTGRVLTLDEPGRGGLSGAIRGMIRRMGEPVILSALRQGMRLLARQFVMGRTIDEALSRAAKATRWRYSFDMLGEAARTRDDAARYRATSGVFSRSCAPNSRPVRTGMPAVAKNPGLTRLSDTMASCAGCPGRSIHTVWFQPPFPKTASPASAMLRTPGNPETRRFNSIQNCCRA